MFGRVEPTTMSRYSLICVLGEEDDTADKHIEWSPASCAVKVNLLSSGPRVRTTECPVSTSYEDTSARAICYAIQRHTSTSTTIPR